MGTINYGTSDYITMAIKPYNVEDFKQDPDFIQFAQDQIDECGGSLEDCINDQIQACYENDLENIQAILDKYEFYYYHITIKPGYYEGFSLDIENNVCTAYDNFADKRDAQKEITQVKKCLIECANVGLVVCIPGWGSAYYDRGDTIKAIGDAITKMRAEAKETPTWAWYNRNIYIRRAC